METELVSDLGRVHRVGQILLVGKDQQEGITELILVEHALQLLAGLRDTLAIVRVDHENDTLSILEVWGNSIRQLSLFWRVDRAYSASRGGGFCPVLRRPTR